MARLRIQVIRITPVVDDAGNLLHHAFVVMKEFAPEEEGAAAEALASYREANADPDILENWGKSDETSTHSVRLRDRAKCVRRSPC